MSDRPMRPGNRLQMPTSPPSEMTGSDAHTPPNLTDWASNSGLISLTDWTTSPTIGLEVIRPTRSDHVAISGSASGVRRLNKRIFGALFSLASAAMVARLIGLLNQGVISSQFGLSPAMTAYFAVQSLPILLTGLIVSALDVSVIPIYVNAFSKRSVKDNSALFSTILNTLLLITGVLTAGLLIGGDAVIHLVAPQISPVALATARQIMPWLFPLLMLNVVAGYLNSILNAKEQFGLPAFAAILIPIAMTVGTLLGVRAGIGIMGLTMGFVAGTALQLLVIFWRTRRLKLTYRLQLDFSRPELRQILALGTPVLISSILILANPIVDQIIASTLGDSVISAINYALKIVDIFVVLMFATTARAVFPYFSRQADGKNIVGLKSTMRLFVWLIGGITLVLATAVFLTAPLLVHVLFERNKFTASDGALTATILRGFSLGLPAMGLGFILPRVFSALKRNSILLWLAPISLACNAALDVVFARMWGPIGISLSTSLVYSLVVVIEIVVLRRILGPLNLLTPPDMTTLSQIGAFEGAREQLVSVGRGAARLLQVRVVQILTAVLLFAGLVVYAVSDAGRAFRLSMSAAVTLIFVRAPYLLLAAWALLTAVGSVSVGDHAISGTLTTLSMPTFIIILGMNFFWLARRNPALIPLTALILWIIVGGIVTIAKHTAPLGAGGFVQALQVYVDFLGVAALMTLVETKDRLHRIIDMLLLPAVVIAGYGIVQTIYGFGGYQDVGVYRAQSIFDWSATLAFYLVIMALLTIYRAFYSHSPWRLFWIVALLIEIGGIYVTYSRTGEIALAAGVVLLLIISGKRSRFAALGLVGLGVIAVLLDGNKLFSRFGGAHLDTFNGRTDFWKALLTHFDWKNLTGYGLGGAQKFIDAATLHAYQSPHNSYLELLFDTGAPGLLFFVLALLISLLAVARPQADSPDRRALRGMVAGVIVACGLFAVTAPHLIQVFGVFFWMVVAMPFAKAFVEVAPAGETPAPAAPPEREPALARQPVAQR